MLQFNQIEPFSVVNFEPYAAALQGSSIRGAKVLGVLDAATASLYINPETMHANIRPLLPQTAPARHTDYMYVKLQLADGTVTAFGLPWIRGETWETVGVKSLRFTVDNVTPTGRQLIMRALAANGFQAVDVEELG